MQIKISYLILFKKIKSSSFETCHLNIKRCETKQLELYGIHWQLNHWTTQFEFLLEYPLPMSQKLTEDCQARRMTSKEEQTIDL